jgi:D-sedoheptulose 7-phosphate isomerase
MQSLDTKSKIIESVSQCVEAVQTLQSQEALAFIESAALALSSCLENGNKILVAGNGGSYCDAMHFVEELTGFFRKRRKPLAAICLGDPGHLSCVSNDVGFEHVFSRLVEAYGKQGDCLILLSTSGNSPNIVRAQEAGKLLGLTTIGFLGKDGGELKGACDLEWIVKGFSTSDRIQEAHMAACHVLIQMIELILGLC